jgi:hypothetical protein
MSEHEHKHAEPVKVKPPVITRNEVALEFTEQVFGKQSNNAGAKFFAPVLDITKVENVKWAGTDNLNSLINKYLRKLFADIYTDAIPDSGPNAGKFQFDQWAADAADCFAGIAKLSDLEEQLDELQSLQQSYALDPDFGSTEGDGEDAPKTPRAVELEKLIREVAGRIKPLRAQKASIELKYAERAAKRKAKEAASATKTAPVKASEVVATA